MWRMWGSPVSHSTRRNACNVENVGNVQHHIPLGGMRAMWRMWGMSSITFHPEECVRCGECGECPASHSTRRNACDAENVGNVQHHIPPGGMRRMWRMCRMSSITLHPEGWLRNRPSDWLIPSGDCAMLQQTKWEGVVQMIVRNCVYPVQNRPNFTFIWLISVYVVLGQPAVPAQYDSFFFGVVQRESFVGRQLVFQWVEGLLLWGVPYPFGILFKQVLNRFGHYGKVRQELHLLVHHAEKSSYVGDVFRFR